MPLASYALGAVAGGLSTLSPCVLPLVPVLMASATSAHRRGPLALALGVAVSFALTGIAVAALGSLLGLDAQLLRRVAAILMLVVGLTLCSERAQAAFARATRGVASTGHALADRLPARGVAGQFALGALLGLIWTPCSGPTLGAAITLAGQRRDLLDASLVMVSYGLGASLPLLAIGLLSQSVYARARGRLGSVGTQGRRILGLLLIVLAVLVLCGGDHRAEAWFLDHAPASLAALASRF